MNRIYGFFSSVKLAIVLLLAIAITSIAGTIIEQQKDPEQYLREYGETLYRIFDFLGFTDVYHSWWYILLLVLLAVNLVVCSVERFPKILKFYKELRKNVPQKFDFSVKVKLPAEKVYEFLKQELEKLGYKTEGKKFQLIFAEKCPLSRFGVYIVHLGVFVVLVGALITAVWGYRGYMELAQGSESNVVSFYSSDSLLKLPFKVRCEEFKIEYYPGTRVPKAYISKLSIIENGKVVVEKQIKVNDPLKYKGIYFYQASYGQGVVVVKLKDENGEKTQDFALGQKIPLGNGIYISVDGISGTRIDISVYSPNGYTESVVRPFVVYNIEGAKKAFAIVGLKPSFYTGIQVAKDPGTWIVWVGSTILVIGMIFAFFYQHKRIWFSLSQNSPETEVKVSFNSNKFQSVLSEEVSKILDKLKELGGSDDNLR